VVDNSALPDLEPASTRFPWLHEVRNETDVHFRKGVNQGARLARGRYLFIFSPDAYLTEGESIARMAEVLDCDPRVGIVGPKTRGDDGLLAPQGERQAGLAYLIAQKSYVDALWPDNPL